jgi:NAD(P)-dependent dehydrogenase (short-subunit alcohol dehydrogenase family)
MKMMNNCWLLPFCCEITVKFFNESVAVITGSTKGNGRAFANTYSEQGANVVVTRRSPGELKIQAGSVE